MRFFNFFPSKLNSDNVKCRPVSIYIFYLHFLFIFSIYISIFYFYLYLYFYFLFLFSISIFYFLFLFSISFFYFYVMYCIFYFYFYVMYCIFYFYFYVLYVLFIYICTVCSMMVQGWRGWTPSPSTTTLWRSWDRAGSKAGQPAVYPSIKTFEKSAKNVIVCFLPINQNFPNIR